MWGLSAFLQRRVLMSQRLGRGWLRCACMYVRMGKLDFLCSARLPGAAAQGLFRHCLHLVS